MVVVSADTCATAVAGAAETKLTRAPMASPLQVSTKAATMTASPPRRSRSPARERTAAFTVFRGRDGTDSLLPTL